MARLSLLSGTSGATTSLLPHPDVLDLTLESAEEQDRWHFINSAQTPAYLLHSFILQESSTCQMSCLSLGKEWGKHFSLVRFPCVTCVSVAEMRKATHRHRHTELCGMMGQRERHSTLYSAVVSMGKESEKGWMDVQVEPSHFLVQRELSQRCKTTTVKLENVCMIMSWQVVMSALKRS